MEAWDPYLPNIYTVQNSMRATSGPHLGHREQVGTHIRGPMVRTVLRATAFGVWVDLTVSFSGTEGECRTLTLNPNKAPKL